MPNSTPILIASLDNTDLGQVVKLAHYLMTDYVRIPIREDEHKRLVALQTELTGKIDSYLTRPSLSDVIKELIEQHEKVSQRRSNEKS